MGAPDTTAFLNFSTPSHATLNGGSRDVIEPATGQVLSTIGIANAADVANASRAAAAAQKAWVAVPPRDKAAILRRAGDLFQQHFDELALYCTRETGAILPKGQHEIREAITICHLASSLPMQSQGHVLPSVPGRSSIARRVPHGVVGVISPFNFPLILTLRAVAPALAAGNAVIVKPDTRTPVSGGLMIARIFAEAGLPKDLLHILPGDAVAGKHLKKVSLELGGANNLIILDDADLDIAASNAAWGAWLHQGQICMAANHIYVHSSIAAQLTQRLVAKATHLPVGDGASGQVALGPLIDTKQRDRVHAMVQDSIQAGAKLEAGATYDGLFYKPTVLSGVKPGMRVFDEETFGPVANLITFDTDEEVIALANNNTGSLSSAIISPSIGRAMAMGQQLKSGMVHINDQTVNDDCVNPFGGPGIAGNGTSVGGPADLEEYTQWQWITVKDTAPAYPF
ncbi:MAG: putative benzaldehyde dehydrogenase oxidoreductase protein [Comamonadaceae bacterium]|nr:MAG: putative benzaldehyde dehydrogenase oxidoreductase protein [Comamonadaceae bacterium]